MTWDFFKNGRRFKGCRAYSARELVVTLETDEELLLTKQKMLRGKDIRCVWNDKYKSNC